MKAKIVLRISLEIDGIDLKTEHTKTVLATAQQMPAIPLDTLRDMAAAALRAAGGSVGSDEMFRTGLERPQLEFPS